MNMSKAIALSIMWISVASAICFGIWLTGSVYCLWAFVFALIGTSDIVKME